MRFAASLLCLPALDKAEPGSFSFSMVTAVLLFCVGVVVGHVGSQWLSYLYPLFSQGHQVLFVLASERLVRQALFQGLKRRCRSLLCCCRQQPRPRHMGGASPAVLTLMQWLQSPGNVARVMEVVQHLPPSTLPLLLQAWNGRSALDPTTPSGPAASMARTSLSSALTTHRHPSTLPPPTTTNHTPPPPTNHPLPPPTTPHPTSSTHHSTPPTHHSTLHHHSTPLTGRQRAPLRKPSTHLAMDTSSSEK